MTNYTKPDGSVMREQVRQMNVIINAQRQAVRSGLKDANANPGDVFNAFTNLVAQILETHEGMDEIIAKQFEICSGKHRNDR